jgi:hypothetical protein
VAAALDAAPAGEPLILYLSDVEVKLKQQSAAAGGIVALYEWLSTLGIPR